MNFGGERDQLTICAVSTPPGYGGISVIRVSGPHSEKIVRALFPKLPKKLESHRAYYGLLKDPSSGQDLDQALCLYLAEGRSFTGEATFEISCHGNPLVCDRILKALLQQGAATALPGEFTYRAFMNNRLDLIQAESVLSLIESRSQKAAELSLRQLEGYLSQKIEGIEQDLTWCLAHIEANIDFSTEGLEVSSTPELVQKLSSCAARIQELLDSYQQGKMIQDGIRIALVGQPNAGKSSLLNLLLRYDRAIVDETPGTTRDIVDAETSYQGLRFVFQDTAGLREHTKDPIEAIGIQRSRKAAESSDMVLFVFDSSRGWTAEDQRWLEVVKDKPLLLLANKSDKLSSETARENVMKNVQSTVGGLASNVLFLSALDRVSRDPVLERVYRSFVSSEKAENEISLSQARHFENLLKTERCLAQGIQALKSGMGAEFVSLELKEGLVSLQQILGRYFDDQIMDRVFKEFCIGK
ncbi:MAG: tRNA uridine-5-carboxymethylaminomethyl(34) synthesis GTPase MnmE [Bdellovibrionales bacterium]